jgi:membrane fusion protein, multidrug efflux system
MTMSDNDSRRQLAGEAPASPLRRFFTRRMVMVLSVTIGLVVLIFGFWLVSGLQQMAKMKAMRQTVTVATTHARLTPWQGQIKAVGTLHAIDGADLAPEVAGIVTRIGFAPGQDVRRGQLLVQLRDDSDRANLAAAQASAQDALLTYRRYAELIKTQAISRTAFDTALANMLSTRANAAAQLAVVEKKAIRAPFDGRVGIRQVDVGQYVGAGTNVVTLQRLDPIYVDFQITQQQVPAVHPGDRVQITSDTFPGRSFPGTIVALNPKVEAATRTVQVRAEIANPGRILLPGMFASVTIDSGRPQQPLTLPQTAIVYNTYGNIVFVVKHSMVDGQDQSAVEQRFVTTGDVRGDMVMILSGVSSSEEVVSAGVSKLKNGTAVTINNSVRLPNDANPRPTEQ